MVEAHATESIGRYRLGPEIATGGTSSVHLGWIEGDAGFTRSVAIKRLHPQFAKDPEFEKMFLDEARLASRIRHLNVIPIIDVVKARDELLLVMEYVRGVSLAALLSNEEPIPLPIVSAIACGVLTGLSAAHSTRDEDGTPLQIIHRDVSPQNVFLGHDGAVRILDFGIAKAVGRLQTTREGEIKGKDAYMAPEQLRGQALDARVDTYAAGVVLWEMLTGKHLFQGATPNEIMMRVLEQKVVPPSSLRNEVPPALDAVVRQALSRTASARFPNAVEMQKALEAAVRPASLLEVKAFLESRCRARFDELAVIEATPRTQTPALPAAATATAFDDATEVDSPPAATRASSWRRPTLIALTLLVLSLLGVALALTPARQTESPATNAAATPPRETPPAAPEPPQAAPSTPISAAPPPPQPPPSTEAPRSARPPVRPRHSDCDPPFRLDKNGVKIPKPQCF